MFVPAKLFQPCPLFVAVGNARIYLRWEQLNVALLKQAPALPTNIRLGWKGLPRANTPDYNGVL